MNTESKPVTLPADVCPSCITYGGHEPGCVRAWRVQSHYTGGRRPSLRGSGRRIN